MGRLPWRSMRRLARGIAALLALLLMAVGGRFALGIALHRTPPPASQEQALRLRARALHRAALVVDAHDDVLTAIVDYDYDLGMDGDEPGDRNLFLYHGLPWLPFPPRGPDVRADMDLARIREGGLDVQFFPMWVRCDLYESGIPGQSEQRVLDMVEALREQVRRHPADLQIATSAADVEGIVSEGKLAALLAVEGGHAIEGRLETLARFRALGVRYMTLTHTCSHGWADSSDGDPLHGGLSDFGREVVREMNRLGILVDVSHASDATFWDVIEVARAPVIASHSSARALAPHPRNLADDMIRAIGSSGGVVMVSFLPLHIDPEKTPASLLSGWHWFTHPRGGETPLALVVDHIDQVVRVAGIEHVGLGSDFDNTPFAPEGLRDVGDYPNLTEELLRRGYSEADVRKILGGNALRVLAEADLMASGAAPGPAR